MASIGCSLPLTLGMVTCLKDSAANCIASNLRWHRARGRENIESAYYCLPLLLRAAGDPIGKLIKSHFGWFGKCNQQGELGKVAALIREL